MVNIQVKQSTSLTIATIIIPETYSRTCYLATDSTNCKLSYIHGVGNLYGLSNGTLKQVFDGLLDHLKGCIILNTTKKAIFDFIKTAYPVYYSHEVPIGYCGGFQFHICFKNTIKDNPNCRTPNEQLSKETIKSKLKALLKSKRRKDDYVDEFINSL